MQAAVQYVLEERERERELAIAQGGERELGGAGGVIGVELDGTPRTKLITTNREVWASLLYL